MLLTIDIGTSYYKSAIWDYEGKRISFSSAPLSVVNYGLLSETDCGQWLNAFENCCKDHGNLAYVKAVIISGNGPTLVPVTKEPILKNGNFLLQNESARLWSDRRAVNYMQDVSDAAGGFVDASFFLPKVLLIKNEEKKLYDNTKFFLGCPEYLSCFLTGEARSVFPCDGFERWFWNDDILKKLNLDIEKFPSFIRPGDEYGTILPSVAEKYGFVKNVKVICGGPDFFSAILGAGITEPGQVCDRTGSSEGINLCTNEYISSENFMSYKHPAKQYWNLSGIIPVTGSAIDRCMELLGIHDYEEFFKIAENSKDVNLQFINLPVLKGAVGIKDSITKQIKTLNTSFNSGQIAKSMLTGIGIAIQIVLLNMEKVCAEQNKNTSFSTIISETKIMEIRTTGGLSHNEFLNQLKADITGKIVLEPVYKETELLGLAMIGGCSLGLFSSFADASRSLSNIKKQYEPDINKRNLYDELFNKYKLMVSN